MISSNTFSVSTQPYYDQCNQSYMNILTVNIMPQGPLQKFVKQIQMPKLSPYQVNTNNLYDKCIYALTNINNISYTNNNLMTPDALQDLVSYLLNNGYQFETQITNMLINNKVTSTNKRLCFTVTYYNNQQPTIVYNR